MRPVIAATKGLKEVDARGAAGTVIQKAAAEVSQAQEWGGLAGRLVLAVLVTVIISRRWLMRAVFAPGPRDPADRVWLR